MYNKAIEEFKETIRINSDDARAHYNLGVAYLRLDRQRDALDEYKILEKLDKDLANNLFTLIYH